MAIYQALMMIEDTWLQKLIQFHRKAAMKQETKVALPKSSIVQLLVDRYFDDIPLKFEVFFLSSADAHR